MGLTVSGGQSVQNVSGGGDTKKNEMHGGVEYDPKEFKATQKQVNGKTMYYLTSKDGKITISYPKQTPCEGNRCSNWKPINPYVGIGEGLSKKSVHCSRLKGAVVKVTNNMNVHATECENCTFNVKENYRANNVEISGGKGNTVFGGLLDTATYPQAEITGKRKYTNSFFPDPYYRQDYTERGCSSQNDVEQQLAEKNAKTIKRFCDYQQP